MRLALGATVLATATACGAKHDPYAASLAKGSEHVEFRGVVNGERVSGTGDFVGDVGSVVIHAPHGDVRSFVDRHTVFTRVGTVWRVSHARGPQTPAEMFRARIPATVDGGLVRRIVLGGVTYDFSRYGEHVSVHVPKTKGS